jgi:hypothetical protein
LETIQFWVPYDLDLSKMKVGNGYGYRILGMFVLKTM